MGRFGNIGKMVTVGMENWRRASANGLTGIRTLGACGNKLICSDGRRLLNMCSCSYLGLNRDPRVIQGAVAALQREGTASISVSRARIAPAYVDHVEQLLGTLFRCDVIVTPSCFVSSACVLPLLASGHLTADRKPVMLFDANAHFSMSAFKPVCGDETITMTCPHNDIGFIEDCCKKHRCVAYIGDGAYSMGGHAPVEQLRELQERFGLFLYLDDSHSISVIGERGEGMVRSRLDDVADRTIIVASLAKAFGATGGLILVGGEQHRELLEFMGGPLGWSQMLNAAGLGAVHAAADIHLSNELQILQQRLRTNLNQFDLLLPSDNARNGLPIRVVNVGDVEEAVQLSAAAFDAGFYTSAVFFPIVRRGSAGIRAMCRADMDSADIEAFCSIVRQHRSQREPVMAD